GRQRPRSLALPHAADLRRPHRRLGALRAVRAVAAPPRRPTPGRGGRGRARYRFLNFRWSAADTAAPARDILRGVSGALALRNCVLCPRNIPAFCECSLIPV